MANPIAVGIDMAGKALGKAGATAVAAGDTRKANQLTADDYFRNARQTGINDAEARYDTYNQRMARADDYLKTRPNHYRNYANTNNRLGAANAFFAAHPRLSYLTRNLANKSQVDQAYLEDLKNDAARMGINLPENMVNELQGFGTHSNYATGVGLPENGDSTSVKSLAQHYAQQGENEWANMQNQRSALNEAIMGSFDNSSHQSSTINALQRFGLIAAILGGTMQNGASSMAKTPASKA